MDADFRRRPGDCVWEVVTLANDSVLEWTVALLESLRRFAPASVIRVIPYDDRMDRLSAALERLGNAEIWTPPELRDWDRLGAELYPEHAPSARGFRKLAAFQVPSARFLFVDADALALAPIAELFAAIAAGGAEFVHFDTDIDQVYRPGPLRDELQRSGSGVGFNCGLFVGRAGDVDPDAICEAVANLDGSWREHLVPLAEQAFLNLAVDRAGLRVRGASELMPDACSTCWPAVGRIEELRGEFRLRESGRWDEGWRFLFAHWAGFQLAKTMPNYAIWEQFRSQARS